jgi:hypothetical protein
MPTPPATILVRHSDRLSSRNMGRHSSIIALNLHSINTVIKAHHRRNNLSHPSPRRPSHSTPTSKCRITQTNGSRLQGDKNPVLRRMLVGIQMCPQRTNMPTCRLIRSTTVKSLRPSIQPCPTARRLLFRVLPLVQHRLPMEHLRCRILWVDTRRRGHFLAYHHSKPMPIISNMDAR